jgi:hypothetical protein
MVVLLFKLSYIMKLHNSGFLLNDSINDPRAHCKSNLLFVKTLLTFSSASSLILLRYSLLLLLNPAMISSSLAFSLYRFSISLLSLLQDMRKEFEFNC